jgi:hypothetical protein
MPPRLWLAFVAFWRVLLDGSFAASIFRLVRDGTELKEPPTPVVAALPAPVTPQPSDALQLLSLLQREGRLVDFLEQDVAAFTDADVGAAARVVHEGCRRALRAHAKLAPVRAEDEGARVTVESGFSPDEIKLTGAVQGAAPFHGILRHKGWRASGLSLPTSVREHDASVIAPAEVEL